jgi:hypothetical protein
VVQARFIVASSLARDRSGASKSLTITRACTHGLDDGLHSNIGLIRAKSIERQHKHPHEYKRQRTLKPAWP